VSTRAAEQRAHSPVADAGAEGSAGGAAGGAVAAVDVGSNSVRLLVVDGHGARLERRIITTRLAQGVDATGLLADDAIARTLSALGELRDIWECHGVVGDAQHVRITATSAVRDARDRDRLLDAVAHVIGVPVDVLSGEEEAALSFRGASGAVTAPAPVVVIDVGGGSTELVVGDTSGRITGSVSLQLGCVRLTERELRHDPATAAELDAAARTVDAVVGAGLAELRAQGADLEGLASAVAVAGTATTLAALHLGLDTYEESRIHATVVPLGAIEDLAARLSALDTSGRAALGPVQPGRAEVLHGGAIVLARTLALLGRDGMYVSESDSLDAVAAELVAGLAAASAASAAPAEAPGAP
jgi:exopolyphosphatase / guanosine-5'-triphosphate,3'-diphosphate pyrophosphatase